VRWGRPSALISWCCGAKRWSSYNSHCFQECRTRRKLCTGLWRCVQFNFGRLTKTMSNRAEESKINFGRSFCTGNRERNSHAVVLAGAGNQVSCMMLCLLKLKLALLLWRLLIRTIWRQLYDHVLRGMMLNITRALRLNWRGMSTIFGLFLFYINRAEYIESDVLGIWMEAYSITFWLDEGIRKWNVDFGMVRLHRHHRWQYL
jgi:hypothetical protein